MRCLVVAGRPTVSGPLTASLEGSGFAVDLCAGWGELTGALNAHLPEVILVDLEDHLALRTLALAESLSLRVPVLVLREGSVWNRPLPFPLSPYLRIYSLASGDHEWRSQIDEARLAVERLEAPSMFRLSDYVQLAALNELSVALHGQNGAGDDVLLEIVGGDVWNAYMGELEGDVALARALPSTPRNLEVDLILSVPAGRQIRSAAWDLLEAFAHGSDAPVPTQAALGTRPISFEEIRDLVEQEKAEGSLPGIDDSTESDSFDELLQRGFGAALARDYRSAAEAFEKALELRPDDARVKFNLDKVRQRLAERRD